VPNNALQGLQFGPVEGGMIVLHGRPPSPGNLTVPLPAGTQRVTFVVTRTRPGALMAPVVVTDGCGAWPTFVGGGPNAF
jgi:hypothetical protein